MENAATTSQERVLALRAEALEICDAFAWPPKCIGSGDFEAGAWEIYAELRCLQQVGAVYVSEALINCCRRHQQWLPLFEDVEARIWLFLGEHERAEERWSALLNHSNEALRRIAEDALISLKNDAKLGVFLATDVDQAFDRGLNKRVAELLGDALLAVPVAKSLDDVLVSTSLRWPMPQHFPWDRSLYTNQLILDVFERQLELWETSSFD